MYLQRLPSIASAGCGLAVRSDEQFVARLHGSGAWLPRVAFPPAAQRAEAGIVITFGIALDRPTESHPTPGRDHPGTVDEIIAEWWATSPGIAGGFTWGSAAAVRYRGGSGTETRGRRKSVLGAPTFTYAEATWTQGLSDWIGAHTRPFAAIGGVPRLLVPRQRQGRRDQSLCLYEPQVKPDLCRDGGALRHRGAADSASSAARQGQGRVAVLVVERWILARFASEAPNPGAASSRNPGRH
jgi:hypothetical protein